MLQAKKTVTLRRQTAEQEGRDLEDLFLPTTSSGRTFKDSLYGQDRGSTHVSRGKREGER